jgi:RHS repeat-associated protein
VGPPSSPCSPPKGRYTYDGQPPIISDTIPANGSVITTAWPVISATLSDPEPGSGVQPLSTTLIIDSEVVTPQVNTAGGFAYTPTVRLTEGVHTVTAQVYDQAGNQTQSGPWSFTVSRGTAPSLGVTKYYMLSSQRVAMRQDDVVYFLHSDHLGSTSLTTDITGTVVAQTRYLPYGEERWITGTVVTDFTFTGQRAERGFGLLDYNARYYDPGLGRWLSPDPIVPDPTNPQSLNRYSYVYNRPLVYIDDGGNFPFIPLLLVLGGVALLSTASNPLPPDQQPPDWVGLLGLGMLFGGGATAAVPELAGAGATAACADGNCTNEAESVAKTVCADGDCTNEAQTVGKALDAACADGNCTNELQAGKQLINITEEGWRHVVERHTVNGLEQYASKSKF